MPTADGRANTTDRGSGGRVRVPRSLAVCRKQITLAPCACSHLRSRFSPPAPRRASTQRSTVPFATTSPTFTAPAPPRPPHRLTRGVPHIPTGRSHQHHRKRDLQELAHLIWGSLQPDAQSPREHPRGFELLRLVPQCGHGARLRRRGRSPHRWPGLRRCGPGP